MFGFSVRTLTNGLGSPKSVGSPGSVGSPSRPDSPKTEVGEIDTRPPFESVRAAVSLFGDPTGSPRARPVTKKTKAEEQKLLEKEAQHHMTLRELDHYRDQLRSTETAKSKALRDLQIANRTVQELTNKLDALCESKQAAIKAAEAAKTRTRELEEQKSMQAQLGTESWKADLDSERQLYKTNSRELISAKQELTNLRQDFDAALEAKLAAFQQEENARQAAEENQETREQLLGEVVSLKKTLEEVRLASLQAEEEHMKLIAEKEIHLIVHKSAKEAADIAINKLGEENGNEDNNLEQKLEETNGAIEVLQEQLKDVRASDLYSLQAIVSELNCGKKELQDAVEEEASIRSTVDSLNLQVEEVRGKLLECMKVALEKEATVQQLQAEIDSTRAELTAAMSRDITAEMEMQLSKLLEDAEKDRRYREEIAKEVEKTRKEAEAAANASKETDEKLEIASKEAEAAQAALKQAEDQIYNASKPEGDDPKESGSVRKIRLSPEEFNSMNSKIEECTKQADEKLEILMAEMQGVSDREKQVQQKVEELLKECEIAQSETEDAVKQAESTEAAKSVAKDELRKWIETGNSALEEKSQ